MSSIENLVRVAEILARAAPDDPATAWLEAGVQEFLQLGGPRLDEALGLGHHKNGRPPAAVWLYHRRDRLICSAVQRAGGVGGFIDCLLEFERNEWPAAQRMTSAPEKLPAVRRELFNLLRIGVPIPRGRRRIQQILARCETSSVSGFADALSLLSAHDRKKTNRA